MTQVRRGQRPYGRAERSRSGGLGKVVRFRDYCTVCACASLQHTAGTRSKKQDPGKSRVVKACFGVWLA